MKPTAAMLSPIFPKVYIGPVMAADGRGHHSLFPTFQGSRAERRHSEARCTWSNPSYVIRSNLRGCAMLTYVTLCNENLNQNEKADWKTPPLKFTVCLMPVLTGAMLARLKDASSYMYWAFCWDLGLYGNSPVPSSHASMLSRNDVPISKGKFEGLKARLRFSFQSKFVRKKNWMNRFTCF